MMRRDGLSCCGNYARVLIISSLVVLSYVFRSKITGYAAKESVLCYLLHFSANVVADCCGRRGGGGGGSVGFPCLYLGGVVRWRGYGRWYLWRRDVACSDFLPQDCLFLSCCCGGDVWGLWGGRCFFFCTGCPEALEAFNELYELVCLKARQGF